ncbi:MAG TPA: trehalose-phosphatase [Hyphomonadaceae bacterium]|nr:trehalose-phosphatase [Hyphomonadaceae bacterium]
MSTTTISIPLRDAALFLDLDGTLAEIAERPVDVRPVPARTVLLNELKQALDGRLAVVSGRPIEDIDWILGGVVTCVAGVHGLEHRDATGRFSSPPPLPRLLEAYPEVEKFVRSCSGLHLEYKNLSLSIHYRQVPALANDVITFARQLAWSTGLKLLQGRMVVELRSPGADKGDAIRRFMKEPLFRGKTPIFVGDDMTDEDGFAAVKDLSGFGVLVGPRRETSAKARIGSVGQVHLWLSTSISMKRFELDLLA